MGLVLDARAVGLGELLAEPCEVRGLFRGLFDGEERPVLEQSGLRVAECGEELGLGEGLLLLGLAFLGDCVDVLRHGVVGVAVAVEDDGAGPLRVQLLVQADQGVGRFLAGEGGLAAGKDVVVP